MPGITKKDKRDYGNAAIVRKSDGNLFLNQRVAGLRCTRKVLPKFLLYWLQTDIFREFFFAAETGNVNQGNVGASGIRDAPIDLPSILEQEEIVRRVDDLLALGDQIEDRYAKARAYVGKLTQSTLAKTFRGELVATEAELADTECRRFESAYDLVARIHADRDAGPRPQESTRRNSRKKATNT